MCASFVCLYRWKESVCISIFDVNIVDIEREIGTDSEKTDIIPQNFLLDNLLKKNFRIRPRLKKTVDH